MGPKVHQIWNISVHKRHHNFGILGMTRPNLDTFALSTLCRQCQSGSAECSLISLGNFYTSDHESYMREKFVGTMKSFRKNISRKKYSRPWRWWLQMSRQMCARNIFFFWQQNLLFSTIFTFLHQLKNCLFSSSTQSRSRPRTQMLVRSYVMNMSRSSC